MSQFVLTFNTPWRNGSGNPIHKHLHCQLNKLHLLLLITGRSAPRPPHDFRCSFRPLRPGSASCHRCRKQDKICLAFLEFSPVLKELLNGVRSLRPELSQPGLGVGGGRVSHILSRFNLSSFMFSCYCSSPSFKICIFWFRPPMSAHEGQRFGCL